MIPNLACEVPQKSRLYTDFYINIFFTFLILIFYSFPVAADSEQEFPVLYKGRYRPAEAYARLFLYDFYHSHSIQYRDLLAFHTTTSSPLDFLWSLNGLGNIEYQTAPLFWIKSIELKRIAKLPIQKNRFSYQEIRQALSENHEIHSSNKSVEDEWKTLSAAITEFENFSSQPSQMESAYHDKLMDLQSKQISPQEIARILEQQFPIHQRLRRVGTLFKSLPSRSKEGEWLALKALTIQTYVPSLNKLQLIGNFTTFSDSDFGTVRQAYIELEKAMLNSYPQDILKKHQQRLAVALQQAYQPLEGKAIAEAHGKQLHYPTLLQLKFESLYVAHPWIPLLIAFYSLGAVLLLISYHHLFPILYSLSCVAIFLAILCHTMLLAMRCFILGRPPVSNMFETVIYVPWIASCFTMLIPSFRKQPLVLFSSCLSAIILLVILELTDLNQSLDQVQAVLDSQFWLMIHVLLVVGSYGIFLLGAVIAHVYLTLFIVYRKESETMNNLAKMILQTMYGGTALLLIGTILGGIWAAQSWGRFWDWDPKESWAFISLCFYLSWIHAYRFHRIGSFGLAIGAVTGWLAISFTWYGVNYILGTGLHSYGFGSGGEVYYYIFLLIEGLFILSVLTKAKAKAVLHNSPQRQ